MSARMLVHAVELADSETAQQSLPVLNYGQDMAVVIAL